MTHDPLCPLTPPTAEYEPYLAEAVRAIQQETPCLCDLIAKVRADERAEMVRDVTSQMDRLEAGNLESWMKP